MAEFMDTNKTDNSDEDKRPQFGNRLLTDPRNVFQHNAWDNVVWDDEQEQEAKQITERQLACPMSEQDQGITSYPVDCPVTKEKRESDANEYWNTFYGIHQNRFFKDRHWLFTEFPELLPKSSSSGAGNVASASSKPDDTLAQTADCCVPNTGTVIGDSLTGGTGQSNNVTSTGVDNIQEICNAAAYSSGNVTAHSANSLTPALGDMSIVNTAERTASNSTDTIHSSGDKTIDLGESGEPTSDDVTVNDRDEESGDGDSDKTVDNNKDIVPEAVKERYPGESATYRILEVGCGVGNTVFPILLTNNDPGLMVYCCDFSSTAVNLVKENPNYNPRRCCAFVCDIADDTSTVPFPDGSLDIIILIFVLSAVHPSKMQAVIDRLAGYLKPGGVILFRDYGRYDMAQLRFKKGRCLSENFYARGDGTMVYFFTQDELREMMTRAGLVEKQNLIDRRLQVNRGKQLKMYRVWIQCKYVKPVQNS